MAIPDALSHINIYGEANLDAGTLRILRKNALKGIAQDKEIRDKIVASHGEETAKKEWDPIFQVDTENRELAVRRIEAELKKRNLKP